jgi:hypothetical protein
MFDAGSTERTSRVNIDGVTDETSHVRHSLPRRAEPDLFLRRRDQRTMSTRTSATVPPTTPPAIAPVLVWCFVPPQCEFQYSGRIIESGKLVLVVRSLQFLLETRRLLLRALCSNQSYYSRDRRDGR